MGGGFIPVKGQRTGHIVKCENCGKEVYQTKTQYSRAKHHYCSNECQRKFQSKNAHEYRKCEICGELFYTKKILNQRFCSTSCQNIWQTTKVGELNPRSKKEKIKCEYCGQLYFVKAYKTQNGQHNFCSTECRRKWYSKTFSQSKEWKEASRNRALSMLENMQLGTDTKPQRIINSMLDDLGIEYVNEKCFEYYAVDNYLPKQNLVIEVMGDFWHCNPVKYSSCSSYEIHKKRIPKDKAKSTYFKNQYGIKILYLWETDIYENPELCRMLVQEYIKNDGILINYHSFNYHLKNNELVLNQNIILPYQDVVNA